MLQSDSGDAACCPANSALGISKRSHHQLGALSVDLLYCKSHLALIVLCNLSLNRSPAEKVKISLTQKDYSVTHLYALAPRAF